MRAIVLKMLTVVLFAILIIAVAGLPVLLITG